MSVSPPSSAIRSRFASRKRRSCSVAWTRKSLRSRAASAASSPSWSLRPVSIASPPFGGRASSFGLIGAPPASAVVFEIRAHPLAQEHRVVSLEDPFARPVSEGAGRFVGFELVQCRVIGQVEQDHVVEVPAVRDVVPADKPNAELLLVLADLARKDRLHEELEERIAAAPDGEVGREHGHGGAVLTAAGSGRAAGAAYCR